MPTVLRKEGFEFFFYSNDHLPIHIHVAKGDGDARFNVVPVVELVDSKRMKIKDLNRAAEIIQENRTLIIQAWNDYENRKRS